MNRIIALQVNISAGKQGAVFRYLHEPAEIIAICIFFIQRYLRH